ncbi:MAG: hypothetical protein EXQ95_13475 [Alphaproteobacteria bacterium]|nr:hypothetical protein [Alphaproteobacteria bacterium]
MALLKRMSSITSAPSEILTPLGDDPELQAALAVEADILARLAETNVRRGRAVSRLRPRDTKAGAAATIKSLLGGAMIPGVNPAAEIEACDEEADLLGGELAAQKVKTQEIVGRCTADAAADCRAEYDDALQRAFLAMIDLHAAVQAGRAIKVRLRQAGYSPPGFVLPDLNSRGALLIGDPHSFDIGRNEGAQVRKLLESRGIDVSE